MRTLLKINVFSCWTNCCTFKFEMRRGFSASGESREETDVLTLRGVDIVLKLLFNVMLGMFTVF